MVANQTTFKKQFDAEAVYYNRIEQLRLFFKFITISMYPDQP